MSGTTISCTNEKRRDQIRERKDVYNGLDYLEVIDGTTLKVFFLNKAPKQMAVNNIVIKGGRRREYQNICAVDIQICRQQRADLDDCLTVTLDKPGDFSTYQLCLVELDAYGNPTDQPMVGFDPRYACLSFNFKVNEPSEIDCLVEPICPPEVYPEPEINYLARDYASFRQLILDRLALTMPEWKERHVPDIGIALVEIMAYVGDRLSYFQDAVATEAYLDTARQRISVRRHARLVDYQMHDGCNARTWVQLITMQDEPEFMVEGLSFLTDIQKPLPRPDRLLMWDDLRDIPSNCYEVFEPLLPTGIFPLYLAHNEIHLYTWGDLDCCLSKGATSAALIDGRMVERDVTDDDDCDDDQETIIEAVRDLSLKVGDVIVFEEVLGPKTGVEADADLAHRHAVRLTAVTPIIDDLFDQPLLEVEWSEMDALPFSLCISAVGPAPYCEQLTNISVARGNILLVDHGRSQPCEDLGIVPTKETAVACKAAGQPTETSLVPGKFRPKLQKSGLTFAQPLPDESGENSKVASAITLLMQNPRMALPEIVLESGLEVVCNPLTAVPPPDTVTNANDDDCGDEQPPAETFVEIVENQKWHPQIDLLDSYFDDAHFVAEMDNFGVAHLRFGDGELGMQPPASDGFIARYRVGNGQTGNVGAESIRHIIADSVISGLTIEPRNLLPAVGGTEPEPISEVKLFAPYAFREEIQRAIIPQDYADIVMREFKEKVQRATAVMRWAGSWHDILVAVDQYGQETAEPSLLEEIAAMLENYRRMGHIVTVEPASHVSLDIAFNVQVLPGYLRAHVRKAIADKLSNRQLPDGSLGFFHPDNQTFGQGIHLSKLVATIQGVAGVESVKTVRFMRQGDDSPEAKTEAIEAGILKLGALEIGRVNNDPNFPEHGQLKLTMEGGR